MNLGDTVTGFTPGGTFVHGQIQNITVHDGVTFLWVFDEVRLLFIRASNCAIVKPQNK